MKIYSITITPEAKTNFRQLVNYLLYAKKNSQEADNLINDYDLTIISLAKIAVSIREPDSDILKRRNLKRLNFHKHDYYLLFKIEEDKVKVTNIFHGWEDVEEKLK